MKTIVKSFILTVLLTSLYTFSSQAQEAEKQKNKTDEATAQFKVSGVCGMCKERIEEALYTTGIKSATWDRKTQLLTVTYRTKKINELKIHELVAGVGHDTEKVKAKDEVYKKLPDCCLYRDGVSSHDNR
jgi:copper chaperone CopZ